MANVYYERAMKSFADGEIALLTSNIDMVLVRTGAGHYVADTSITGDQFLSAIALADRISTSAFFTGKVTALMGLGGVFLCDNSKFPSVTAGAPCGAIVIVQDTGVAATSRIIVYLDGYSGLPYTPTGADGNVSFPAAGVFQL